MRLRIHQALFAGFLGVTGLLVILIALLVGFGVRDELRSTFQDELRRQLSLASAVLADAEPDELDRVTRAAAARLAYRLTVIDESGRVLADSEVRRDRVADMENHADRPEIRAAWGGGIHFSTRVSATLDDPLLYGARREVLSDGRTVVVRIAAPLTRIEAALDRIQNGVVFTGIVATIIALIMAYILSRALARPLVVLADRARLLAAGNLSIRVPMERRVQELQNLAVAFNRLGEELQERIWELAGERDEMQVLIDSLDQGVLGLDAEGRLVRWNRAATRLLELPEDLERGTPVTALVRHPELRRFLDDTLQGPESAREVRIGDRDLVLASHPLSDGGAVTSLLDASEIRRLERVRRDFVANASHELKTPLTSIRGFAETLLDDPDTAPDIRERFLTAIRSNTLRLQNLVEDLLDLSRLESGGWVADPESVDVADLAREVYRNLPAAGTEDRDFAVEGRGMALADTSGLVQVFRNLFENAIRHTVGGGSIQVEIEPGPRKETLTVKVTDDGEGIPQECLPRIFERFYRADSSRARDQGGTGLGLSIVRHLVNSMGGEVFAESELGQGASIVMVLPRAAEEG
ncbi:MAG TPA: ATP-binding protein [Longimicrobiales bacterium]|nr:ATP-binding protein [Longimicrobiales bacterium]